MVFTKKKSYTKKVLSSAQKSAVATIAKKVVHKEAETKSFLSGNNTSNLSDDTVYAWNLSSGLPQGDDHDDRIGNKIHMKNIYMRLHLYGYNSAILGRTNKTFRIMIIKTKQALSNTYSSVTATDIFRAGTTTNGYLVGFPDRNKITVLYDKQVKLPMPVVDVAQSTTHTINLKINKTEFYESDSSLYLKNGNYYMVISAGGGDSTGVNTTFVRFNYAVNFKDI